MQPRQSRNSAADWVSFGTTVEAHFPGLTVTRDMLHDLIAEARQVGDDQLTSMDHPSTAGPPKVIKVAPALPTHNLPSELTSFVGRERERMDVGHRLQQGRLLTIGGVGGVGKTRLALRVAADQVDNFADGIWLVQFDTVSEPTLIAGAVARVVGVCEQPGIDLADTLVEALKARDLLLLLDNCEHLVRACAELVERLLRTCPHLRVLATSQEPLGVSGEIVWRLPSLAVPSISQDGPFKTLAGAEAVRLFTDRSSVARPDFRLSRHNIAAVVQICRRLDGIPLAIELAAARVAILSPEEIADRLDDRFHLLVDGGRTAPTRQQTLRAAVDWSYDLLDTEERELFDGMSVFSGTFSLVAIESVAKCAPHSDGAARAERGLLQVLASLVAKSLVVVDHAGSDEDRETRYRLLETLRAYGREQLAARGELDLVRRCHATWVEEFVEQADGALHGPDQGSWLRRIERELPNVQAALAWAIERQETAVALRLAGAHAWYWFQAIRGAWMEGRLWLESALSLPDSSSVSRLRAKALSGVTLLAMFQGDFTSSRARIEEHLSLAQALRDDASLLEARSAMAQLFLMTGDFAGAERMDDETPASIDRLSDSWSACRNLANKAYCALNRGDPACARACLEESARLARQMGDSWSLAMAMGELGDLERVGGAHHRAGILYAESLTLHESLGIHNENPSLRHNLGYVELAQRDPSAARAHFTAAQSQFRWRGDRRGIAECIIGFAAVAAAEGEFETAARLFGAGQGALEALGTQIWPSNRPDYEHWLFQTRTELPTLQFESMWSEGQKLSPDEAVKCALDRLV